jgi:hypothetical protein
MNRLAEKVLPMMNEQELMDLVLDHYKGESQTLTTGAEANFLKFKELIGVLNEEERERWEHIKGTFTRGQFLGGGDKDDPVGRVVKQIGSLEFGMKSIEGTLRDELSKPQTTTLDLGGMDERLEDLRQTLAEGLANQQASAPVSGGEEDSATAPPASDENLVAISGAIEKYLDHSSQSASSSEQNQQMLAERQQAMMEFIQKSNAELTQALTQSQAAMQAQQLQAALQQVGNLFADYQMRTKDLQDELKNAQPSEVVVDLNAQMAQNSDELINQILQQLDQAQQPVDQEPPPSSPEEDAPSAQPEQ